MHYYSTGFAGLKISFITLQNHSFVPQKCQRYQTQQNQQFANWTLVTSSSQGTTNLVSLCCVSPLYFIHSFIFICVHSDSAVPKETILSYKTVSDCSYASGLKSDLCCVILNCQKSSMRKSHISYTSWSWWFRMMACWKNSQNSNVMHHGERVTMTWARRDENYIRFRKWRNIKVFAVFEFE